MQKKSTFVKGALILAFAGLICKVVGAFFRVALFNVLGSTGMPFYEMAYPIYSYLLVLSTAGLPTAISKIVSEKVALNDYRAAHKTFQVAYKALFVIGIVTMSTMLIFAPLYANVYQLSGGVYSLRAIAPALFFVSIISAYRGYFQGLQIMSPTAISQIIEQIGKFAFGLAFAVYFSKFGLHYGAMGALIGVTISEFAAMLILVFIYNLKKGSIKANMRNYSATKRERGRSILRKLIIVAFPITIGASIMPLAGMIDGYIAMNLLPKAGYLADEAQQLYGIYAGAITSIINMPAIVSLSIGMALVPAISRANARKDISTAKKTTKIGLKLAILFGLPCGIGMNLVAEPILKLLYSSLTPYELPIATQLLSLMSVAVFFLIILQIMTSIIHAYGEYTLPVINLFIGCVINIVVSCLLVIRPEFNIKGVAIGTLVCYGVASFINIIYVFKFSKIRFSFSNYIAKPIIASGFMGTCVYLTYPLLERLIGYKVALLITILIAVVVYAMVAIAVKAIEPQDMEFLPGGKKLKRILVKSRIWSE